MTSTRWSLWSFFDSGTEFLIFCYLLVFVGIVSFLLLLVQIVTKKEV